MDKIRNPFEGQKKTNWAAKAQSRVGENNSKVEEINKLVKNKPIERVAKSFKVYPGKIPRDFDKRVNKMQVHFDDLDFDKTHVDSGKYMMFLMAFAEKYGLYELYTQVSENSEFNVDSKKLNEFAKKLN